jgi:hypothetical protein
VVEFQREHRERWTPAPLLARLAANGGKFADLDQAMARAESGG